MTAHISGASMVVCNHYLPCPDTDCPHYLLHIPEKTGLGSRCNTVSHFCTRTLCNAICIKGETA